MFGCIKLLIWRKLSKFVQTVPQITNQLSQGELSCLWENNKDKMMLLLFGELFNNRFSSLLDQLSSGRLVMFTELQCSAGISLAPPISANHFKNIFNSLWNEQKLKEIRNCLDVISGNPVDRTVSCYLLILLFLTLDKADLYTDNEPFIQKLRGIRESVEQSLRSYLESV